MQERKVTLLGVMMEPLDLEAAQGCCPKTSAQLEATLVIDLWGVSPRPLTRNATTKQQDQAGPEGCRTASARAKPQRL